MNKRNRDIGGFLRRKSTYIHKKYRFEKYR